MRHGEPLAGESATSGQPWVEALFNPRTIAIVGASSDPKKWGHTLAVGALRSRADRSVLLVNRRVTEVLGHPSYRSVVEAALPLTTPVDLAVVSVPAGGFAAAVADSVSAGARAIVGITVGVDQPDAESMDASAALSIARAAGARLLGPNSLGVATPGSGLQLAHDALVPGDVALITQSGNLGLDLAALLADRDVGISRFASLGNQSDLTVVDLLLSCVEHDQTRIVAVYIEDVIDGRRFLEAIRALRAAGKPVVVLTTGGSEASARSAVSHTGSLTSSRMVIDAACAAAGAHRVDHPPQLADLVVALRGAARMTSYRVGIVTDGGGHGATAADVLASFGLETPALLPPTTDALSTVVWEHATVTNPVDLAGCGEADMASYGKAIETLLGSSQVDGVLLTGYFGGYSATGHDLGESELAVAGQLAATVAAQSKPLVVHTIYPEGPTSRLFRTAGISVHRDIDRACAVLSGLVERPITRPLPALPPPAQPVLDTSYETARALFSDAGIRFPTAVSVTSEAGLVSALEAPGRTFPVVLKALGRVHKSENGGVVLNLSDADEVLTAYAAIRTRLNPPAVSVETMADLDTGIQMIIGCVQDPRFGPVVTVGLGGVFTEVLGDVVCAVAPVCAETATELFLSLQGAPVLSGARGRASVDLDALAEVVVRVADLAAAHPELREVELNPVLAGPHGALALDARIVLW